MVDTKGRRRWLELVKAIALILIFFNHALEAMNEFPLVANPKPGWAPLADRIAQLEPTTGGAWDLAFNAIRYPGLLGEVGVQLFIIASGLGLTLSALWRGGVGQGFLRRRLDRIAPTWITIHFLALVASVPLLLFIGGNVDKVAAAWDARFWASLVGFRITPDTIYYLVAAWWFIALLIQLYLAFPYLYRLLIKMGPERYWLVIGGAIAVKLVGLLVFDLYLDAWSRGAIFITRLPEFALGMMIAVWLQREANPLVSRWALAAAVAVIPAGIASSLILAGNAWGPFLYGAGLFVVLYRLFEPLNLEGRLARTGDWVGRHSLSLFLVHQPILLILMPGGIAGPGRVLGGLLVSAIGTVLAGVVVEWVTTQASAIVRGWAQRQVLVRRLVAVALGAILVYGSLVAVDLWVRATDPQEALGWGERPSLQADDVIGWRLLPDQTTRLQWQTYDYEVTANRFGTPGPADDPGPNDVRILTVGDAFTSAEGVDTADAWPRLLETKLAPATVWNAAVTGYGPNQYAAIASELAPNLAPDVVIVGFFVNDFDDAATTIEDFQDSIGFGKPDPTGIVASLQWEHISNWLRYRVTEPVLAQLGKPNRTGYYLAHFDAFDRGSLDEASSEYAAALEALSRLRSTVPAARLVMMLVPASIQVCDPAALDYYPDNVDIDDYDLDQPQRLARLIAEDVGAEVLDLRAPLQAAPECPYQPGNMHWLETGHELVAEAVAGYLGS